MDILRSSTQQGALNRSVIQQQGLITEAGYTEQAASYNLMQQTSGVAAQAQTVAAGGEEKAATEYTTEANLYNESATGDFISAAISGVAGIGSIAAAFATGGASTAAVSLGGTLAADTAAALGG